MFIVPKPLLSKAKEGEALFPECHLASHNEPSKAA